MINIDRCIISWPLTGYVEVIIVIARLLKSRWQGGHFAGCNLCCQLFLSPLLAPFEHNWQGLLQGGYPTTGACSSCNPTGPRWKLFRCLSGVLTGEGLDFVGPSSWPNYKCFSNIRTVFSWPSVIHCLYLVHWCGHALCDCEGCLSQAMLSDSIYSCGTISTLRY